MPGNPIRLEAGLRKAQRVASAACLIVFCAAAQDAHFDRSGWLSDYAALKQALEKRYSNLAWFGSPEGGVELPALDRQTLAALNSAQSPEQMQALRRALQLDPGNAEVQKSLATFTRQKEKLTEDICPMDWVWRERRGWSSGACRRLVEAGSAGGPLAYLAPGEVADSGIARRLHWPAQITPLWGTWTGPVYVLTNGRTYSAAEMFAALMQNNRAAKIVGAPTGGDGCGFMTTPDPLVLPFSQLRFRLPNCVRVRADGTDEVAGIKPDIPVLPSDGEDDRALALRLLDQLRADLKRREVRPGYHG